jgi:hypothetical protein
MLVLRILVIQIIAEIATSASGQFISVLILVQPSLSFFFSFLKIFQQLKLRILLAAPTGRAAKKMSEATGWEAKTIHRLLEYSPKKGGFNKDQDHPLEGDVVIIDEIQPAEGTSPVTRQAHGLVCPTGCLSGSKHAPSNSSRSWCQPGAPGTGRTG